MRQEKMESGAGQFLPKSFLFLKDLWRKAKEEVNKKAVKDVGASLTEKSAPESHKKGGYASEKKGI